MRTMAESLDLSEFQGKQKPVPAKKTMAESLDLSEFQGKKDAEKRQRQVKSLSEPYKIPDYNATDVILGAGDAARNTLSAGYAKPAPFPHDKESYGLGQNIGDIGSFLGGGSLLKSAPYLKGIPKAFEAIPKLGKKMGPMLSRLAGSAGFEALQDPNNRLGGAESGLMHGIAGETMAAPFRAVGKMAEQFNPMKWMHGKEEELAQSGKGFNEEMKHKYETVKKEFGSTDVNYGHLGRRIDPKDYLMIPKSQMMYLNAAPESKRAYQAFLDDPTFAKLHDFQSQLGIDANKHGINSKHPGTDTELTRIRQDMHGLISEFLGKHPGANEMYQEGREIGRNKYYPMINNEVLQKIIHGDLRGLSPSQVQKAIQDVIVNQKLKKQPLIEGHPLHKMSNDIEEKMHKTELTKNLTEILGGGAGLAAGLFNPLLAIPGAGAGYLSAKHLIPKLMELAQNPVAQRGGNKARAVSRAVLAQTRDEKK